MSNENWLGVIGSREATYQMRRDIGDCVTRAIRDGESIVSGGSTGVDTIATVTAFNMGGVERLRVYLPTTLGIYVAALSRRADEGKCRHEDARETIAHLRMLQVCKPESIIESTDFVELTPEAFYARNQLILSLAQRIEAFHLHGNATASKLIAGTEKTAQLATRIGLGVEEHHYNV